MLKNLFFVFVAMVCCGNLLNAQNVFSPSDAIVTYNSKATAGSSTNPNQPANGVMSKWVRTSRMSWSSTNFKCYIWNGMCFRLRFPNNYNPANATKYPVVVFFHGGGEIGTIYDNEDHLYWGAQLFEQRINNGEWNGFLLFPQQTSVGWDDTYFSRINSVLDTLQKYNNTDPDRLITMGLSSGGYGSLAYGSTYPQRVAASLSSSPVQARILSPNIPAFVHIPQWVANGGLDVNPDPYNAQAFYQDFRNGGGNIYSTYYVNDGHDTWENMWAQKNAAGSFISDVYWNTAHKAQPLVYFQNQQFCSSGPVSARMGITAGYYAYQWQLNGATISGATSNEYTATAAGSYAVRFMRTATSAWSAWTPKPVVISTKACAVDTLFSEHFTADNAYTSASEYSSSNFTCEGGIKTSGTDLFTQDASGVQGNRFLINYTTTGSGCTFAAGDRVWSAYNPVTVSPNTNYEFTFYLGNQNTVSLAQIAPVINNVTLIAGSVSATGTGNTSWKKYTYTWNSGSSTLAYLALINKNAATTGNDFAIDEISFKLATGATLPVPGCTTNLLPASASTLTTNTTASLSWTAATYATSYDVYLWTGATVPTVPVANVTTNAYNATGLSGSALYKWYVVPKNSTGSPIGCSGNQTTFTTAPATVPPTCVTNVSPVAGSTLTTVTTATLTWNTAAGAISYDVYLWTGATAPATATANVTTTSYNATGLTGSGKYNWYVVPKNNAGAPTACSTNQTSFTTAPTPTPPLCVNNRLPVTGSTLTTSATVTLTWDTAATATSYDVYLWTGATAPTTATASVTTNSYSATGLTGSSLYNWYVVPKNTVGAPTGCSTNQTSFTTAPTPVPPVCVGNSSPTNGQLLTTTTTATLTWDTAATATSYDVYLWTGATAPTTATANVTTASYNATGLSSSSVYNWYVVPKNTVGAPTGCSINQTSFTTATAATAPACVTNSTPTNGQLLTTTATATLTWNTAATASSYDVYLWTGATAPTLATASVTTTSYSATGLSSSSVYKWYVVPKNTVGAATGCSTNVTTFTTGSTANTLLGYIKVSVGPWQACADSSVAGRIAVYGTSIANGSILYTDAGLTNVYNGGWNWFSFVPAPGSVTTYAFAVYPTGGILMLRDCIAGVFLRVANTSATVTMSADEAVQAINRMKDSAAKADALIPVRTGKLSIYPNPVVKGQLATLQINSEAGGTTTVQVTGIAGNIIKTYQLNAAPGGNIKTLPTTGLAPGLYVIRIRDNAGKASVLKLVIQ